MEFLGTYLKKFREKRNWPIRVLASKFDIDPSTLGKIEKGERFATEKLLKKISEVTKEDIREIEKMNISDKISYQLYLNPNALDILKFAIKKIDHLRTLKAHQKELNFK